MRMELPVARHSFYAFFPGISVRTYTDEQLAELEAKEQEVHTWHGKEYNAYEASQQQRKMETKMRAQRAEVKALQRGDGSKDDINAAQVRYLNTLHEYQAFSKKMKLPEQMERVYMDGLGRVVGGKYKVQYYGIPKNWRKVKEKPQDTLKKVNPKYNKNIFAIDKDARKYNENCVNCVVAYEMRRRGYDVTAGPVNSKLKRNPEVAWVDPDIRNVERDGIKELKDTLAKWGDGARAQVCVIWKGRENCGHTFVAEQRGKSIAFLDVQTGTEYNENIFNRTVQEKTRYWRIDNLKISDRGVSSCERK